MGTESRPKITYILPLYDSRTGSHFFHIYEMLSASARMLDIFVVIERSVEIPEGFPFPVYCQYFRWAPFRFIELLTVLTVARFHGRGFFYTHYSFFGGVASWLVSSLMGGIAYYWNAGMPWLYARSWFTEAVFRFVLRHTILVTGTDGLACEYARRYTLQAESTRVMPNWINRTRFLEGPRRDDARRILGIAEHAKVILFVHRLSRRKGARLLPDIIERVIGGEKHAIFLIVGDGPERTNLERMVSGEGKGDRVRIIGEIPHRDIVKYFSAADVFLLPSEEEGFPHVLLEAMAVGIPYVASDVGGVRECTPPELRSTFIVRRQADAFAEALLTLIRLPRDTAVRTAAIEKEWVRRFDLASVRNMFTALFA